MGRRHWQGKRRVRESGPEGDSCWFCMSGRFKRRLLVERRLRRERQQLRRAGEENTR